MVKELHDYQKECVKSVEKYYEDGGKSGVIVLATGGGKTLTFSHIGKRFIDSNPGKLLILSHTDELVRQNRQEFVDAFPGVPVGVFKADVRQTTQRVISASVPSLRNPNSRAEIRDVGMIVVDECHHSRAKTYVDILEHYGAFDDSSSLRVLGATATPARGDKKKLSTIFDDIIFSRDLLWMIRNGYLLDVRGKRFEVPDFDMSKVRKSAGDYSVGDMGRAIGESLAPELSAKAYMEHASDQSGIVFVPTVESAELMREAFIAKGISTEVVHGKLLKDARRYVIARFDAGITQVLVNCMALTEGFNSPRASCVVITRPTRSAPLYQQMVGRALRKFGDQTEALILDMVGASNVHDLRSLRDLTEIDVPDDEKLTLVERADMAEADAREKENKPHYYGPVEVKDFNPLVRDSSKVWLKTEGGTYYLVAGEVYIFLIKSRASIGWDVAWCSKPNSVQYPVKTGGFTEHLGMDLQHAFAYGEDTAEKMGGASTDWLSSKGAKWRSGKASPSSIKYAQSLGLGAHRGMSPSDVSALIEGNIASPRIDDIVLRLNGDI